MYIYFIALSHIDIPLNMLRSNRMYYRYVIFNLHSKQFIEALSVFIFELVCTFSSTPVLAGRF